MSVVSEEDRPVGPSALLLLADGRFPSGGYAHSGGLEPTIAIEGIGTIPDLEAFVTGRLATVGMVASGFAAAACAATRSGCLDRMATLDAEFAARTPSPALRTAASRLGRQMVRAGRAVWPDERLESLATTAGPGPYQPVALGAVAAAAGLGPADASLAAAHDAVISPATAAVRLLGLDPFAVHALVARLGPQITGTADTGAGYADADPANLPSDAAPLLDIAAEHYSTWEVRLHAS